MAITVQRTAAISYRLRVRVTWIVVGYTYTSLLAETPVLCSALSGAPRPASRQCRSTLFTPRPRKPKKFVIASQVPIRLFSTKNGMIPVRVSPTTRQPVNATQTCYHDSPFLENDPATQNVLVILNSPIRNPPSLLFQRLWDSASFRVCADGGANRLHDASKEYVPNAIRGDLDSLRQDVRSYYEERGASVEQDSDQNTNDLDKALQLLHSKRDEISQTDEDTWTGRVCIYGAFGGRFDQEMGCIQALFKWSDTFRNKLFLVDDSTCAFFLPPVVRNEIRLPFYGESPANKNIHAVGEGPTCGLIPIGHRCEFVHTTGLKWNLNGDVALEFGGMVSTSNRAVDEVVTVRASHPLVFTAEMTAGNEDNDT